VTVGCRLLNARCVLQASARRDHCSLRRYVRALGFGRRTALQLATGNPRRICAGCLGAFGLAGQNVAGSGKHGRELSLLLVIGVLKHVGL
jgi:hypothetical protein